MEVITELYSVGPVVALLQESCAGSDVQVKKVRAEDIKDIGICVGRFTTRFLPNNGADLRLGSASASERDISYVMLTTRGALRAIDTSMFKTCCAHLWPLPIVSDILGNSPNAEVVQNIVRDIGGLLHRLVVCNYGMEQYSFAAVRAQLQAQLIQRDAYLEQLRSILQNAVVQSAVTQSVFEGITAASRKILKKYPTCLFVGDIPPQMMNARNVALLDASIMQDTADAILQDKIQDMTNMVLGGMNKRCRAVFGELCCEHAYMMELDVSVSDGTERMLHMLWQHKALEDTNPGYSLQASFNDLIGYTEAGFAQRCFLDRANRVRIAAVRRPEGECLAFDVGLGAGEPADWDRAYELLRAILFTGDIKNAKIAAQPTIGAEQQEFHKVKPAMVRMQLEQIPAFADGWKYMQDFVSLSIVQRFKARGVLLKAPNKQQIHIVLQFKTLRDCEAVYRFMTENSRRHGIAAVIKLAQPNDEGAALTCTMDLAPPYDSESFAKVKSAWMKLFETL